MSQANNVQSFLQSSKTKPCVYVKSGVQNDDRKSMLRVTLTGNSNNEVKGVDHYQRPQLNPKYRTHFDFAPWLELDCIKQSSTGSIHSTSEVKTVLDYAQKKKEMLSKYDTLHQYNSFNNLITLDEEESNVFNGSLENSFEGVSEDEKAELKRRMLGYFD